MFERLDASGRKVTGAGLGLAIAREYATAMGGRLDGHPRDGGGAVFEITLPAQAAPAEPIDGVIGVADAPIDDASVPVVEDVRPSVLYIEDNPMNAEVVVEFLSSAPGLRVDVVETIAEGRAVLAERTPSLLLLDLNLPDGFGGDLAEELEREG